LSEDRYLDGSATDWREILRDSSVPDVLLGGDIFRGLYKCEIQNAEGIEIWAIGKPINREYLENG